MGEGGGGEEKGRPDTKPFKTSLPFSLPFFPFSPETPDTQATLLYSFALRVINDMFGRNTRKIHLISYN